MVAPTIQSLAACASLLAAIPVGSVGELTPLVLTKTAVPTASTVTDLNSISLSNAGHWLADVRTNRNGDAYLLNGQLVATVGSSLASPSGARLLDAEYQSLTASGHIAGVRRFSNAGPGVHGVFINETLLIAVGDTVTAPELPPGSVYSTLTEAVANDNNQVLFGALVKPPGSFNKQALILLELDSTQTTVLSERVVAQSGDMVSGSPGPLLNISTSGKAAFALNNAGQVLYAATTSTTPFTPEFSIILDDQVVALAENDSFGGPLDLNESGDVVYSRRQSDVPQPNAYFKNGELFVQSGDTVAGVEIQLVSAPPLIDEKGRVLWIGRWESDDFTRDSGVFLDDQLVLEEGVATYMGAQFDFGDGTSTNYFGVDLRPDGSAFAVGGYLRSTPDAFTSRAGFFLVDLPD